MFLRILSPIVVDAACALAIKAHSHQFSAMGSGLCCDHLMMAYGSPVVSSHLVVLQPIFYAVPLWPVQAAAFLFAPPDLVGLDRSSCVIAVVHVLLGLR